MSVRPVFNISKEQWFHFKKLFPDFEKWLEDFASDSRILPDPVLRVRTILNLIKEFDAEVMVYLKFGLPEITLTEERTKEIAELLGKKMEKIDSDRWEVDMHKPLGLPPLTKDSLDSLVPWYFKSLQRTEQGFEGTSFYDVLKCKQWLLNNNISHGFHFLPDYRYLIKI